MFKKKTNAEDGSGDACSEIMGAGIYLVFVAVLTVALAILGG